MLVHAKHDKVLWVVAMGLLWSCYAVARGLWAVAKVFLWFECVTLPDCQFTFIILVCCGSLPRCC